MIGCTSYLEWPDITIDGPTRLTLMGKKLLPYFVDSIIFLHVNVCMCMCLHGCMHQHLPKGHAPM